MRRRPQADTNLLRRRSFAKITSRGRRPKSRVLRGGSFMNNATNVRSASRNNNQPNNRNNTIGFEWRALGGEIHVSPGQNSPLTEFNAMRRRSALKCNTVQRTWDKLPACQPVAEFRHCLHKILTSWKLIPRSLNGIALKCQVQVVVPRRSAMRAVRPNEEPFRRGR